MAYGRRVRFEELRELAFGSIGASYTAIGGAATHPGRLVAINNSTDVDLYISLDGITTQLRIASGSAKLFDCTSNEVRDDGFFVDEGTTFYAKQTSAGAPSKGLVWVEFMYSGGN